jgi:hypothetical protein
VSEHQRASGGILLDPLARKTSPLSVDLAWCDHGKCIFFARDSHGTGIFCHSETALIAQLIEKTVCDWLSLLNQNAYSGLSKHYRVPQVGAAMLYPALLLSSSAISLTLRIKERIAG